MNERDAPQAASAEEETRIGETPAVFANKVYVSPVAGGAKITFAETQRVSGADRASPSAWRYSCNTPISPSCDACSTGRPPCRRHAAGGLRRLDALSCSDPVAPQSPSCRLRSPRSRRTGKA